MFLFVVNVSDECWGVKQSKYFWQFWRDRSPGHEHLCTCCSNLRSCSAHCRQRPLQSLLLINTLCTGYWLQLESGPHHWDISRSLLSMSLLNCFCKSGLCLSLVQLYIQCFECLCLGNTAAVSPWIFASSFLSFSHHNLNISEKILKWFQIANPIVPLSPQF